MIHAPIRSKPSPAARTDGRPIDLKMCVVLASLTLLGLYVYVLINAAHQGVWVLDRTGGLGRIDFSEFWAAGRLTIQGHAQQVYDWKASKAVLEQHAPGAFAHAIFPFFYPPFLLLLLGPIMATPVLAAAGLWIGGGYIAYLAAIRLISDRPLAVLAAAAAPAAFLVVCVGQNGLLSAALLCGGLALMDRRPLLAGVLIGALAYKPQLGVLIPIVLVATGRWRVFVSAAVTVCSLIAVCGLVFGWQIYALFGQAAGFTHGAIPALSGLSPAKLQSVYGLALVLGATKSAAWAVQILVAAIAIVTNVVLWRSRTPLAIKAAGLASCVLLVSPYSAIYDLTVLVPALIFLIAGDPTVRPTRGEIIVLGIVYLCPLIFPFTAFPIGPPLCALVLTVVILRWRANRRLALET